MRDLIIIIARIYYYYRCRHLLFNKFFQLPLNTRKYLVKPFRSAEESRDKTEELRADKFPSDRLLNIDANGRCLSFRLLLVTLLVLLQPLKSSWYSVPTNTISLSSNRLSKLSYVHVSAVLSSFRLFRRTDGNFRMNPNAVDFLSSEHEWWSGCCNTRLPGGKGGCAHKLLLGIPPPDMATHDQTTFKRNIGTSAVWLVNYNAHI